MKLGDLLQSLPLHELPNAPAVGELQEVRLEIAIGKAKVEILFGEVLHLLHL